MAGTGVIVFSVLGEMNTPQEIQALLILRLIPMAIYEQRLSVSMHTVLKEVLLILCVFLGMSHDPKFI